jgi:hypothetical protein
MDSLIELVATAQSLWLAGMFLFLGIQLMLRPSDCAAKITSLADRFQSRGVPSPAKGSAREAVPDTPLVRGVLRASGFGLAVSGLLYVPGLR